MLQYHSSRRSTRRVNVFPAPVLAPALPTSLMPRIPARRGTYVVLAAALLILLSACVRWQSVPVSPAPHLPRWVRVTTRDSVQHLIRDARIVDDNILIGQSAGEDGEERPIRLPVTSIAHYGSTRAEWYGVDRGGDPVSRWPHGSRGADRTRVHALSRGTASRMTLPAVDALRRIAGLHRFWWIMRMRSRGLPSGSRSVDAVRCTIQLYALGVC